MMCHLSQQYVAVLFLTCVITSVMSACDNGWFGTNCSYQCHCSNNNCVDSGECRPGSKCLSEWFGPACQYQDLFSIAVTSTTPPEALNVLKDKNEETCLNGDTEVLTINLNYTYVITWIRVTGNNNNLKSNITLVMNDEHSMIYTCNNTYLINERTMDLFCDLHLSTQQLTLKGKDVGHLCSLSISGGRNLALKQKAVQSTDYSWDMLASKAVDGNRDTVLYPGLSCAHTNEVTDLSPNWKVTFSNLYLVNRYVLFNRVGHMNRLQKARLYSYNGDNILVFNDTLPEIEKIVYTLTSLPQNVLYVKIYAGYQAKLVLTLCEVEIYGDSICPNNRFGLECTELCNCESKTETCHVATGGCTSGCAAGFYGDGCQKSCQQFSWGPGCTNNCSSHCVDETCDRRDGTCHNGCVAGYSGNTCNQTCPIWTWGKNCNFICSEQCLERSCNTTSGVCIKGCKDGYTAGDCTIPCPSGTWGKDCQHNCSGHCLVNPCNVANGICDSGCESGFLGDDCRVNASLLVCDSEYNKGLASGIGIGIGLTLGVVALIGILIYIWLKRRQKPALKASDTPGMKYDHVGPVQQNEHQYGTGNVYDTVQDVIAYNVKTSSVAEGKK